MKSVEKRLLNPKINAEHLIEVIPPGYGKPSVFAYKVYQATILKKLSDYGHPVPMPRPLATV